MYGFKIRMHKGFSECKVDRHRAASTKHAVFDEDVNRYGPSAQNLING
jgi:hypothetical protein